MIKLYTSTTSAICAQFIVPLLMHCSIDIFSFHIGYLRIFVENILRYNVLIIVEGHHLQKRTSYEKSACVIS